MKIVALGGSPKGKLSVTLQYVLFLQKVLAGHEFEIVQISSRIRKLEKAHFPARSNILNFPSDPRLNHIS